MGSYTVTQCTKKQRYNVALGVSRKSVENQCVKGLLHLKHRLHLIRSLRTPAQMVTMPAAAEVIRLARAFSQRGTLAVTPDYGAENPQLFVSGWVASLVNWYTR